MLFAQVYGGNVGQGKFESLRVQEFKELFVIFHIKEVLGGILQGQR